MHISQALDYGKKKLKALERPKLEAEVILSHLLEVDRVFLKTHAEKKLSLKQGFIYKRLILKRAKHLPMAQVLGYKNWAGLKILVNSEVLIPRDETEVLMEQIVQREGSLREEKEVEILDIGTGSGCIAIYLKQYFPKATVLALDISKSALRMAQKNAKIHQVDLNLLHSDLLEKIPKTASFDIIVANLPYVPESVKVSLEVSKEPRGAIFAREEGLEVIKRLAMQFKEKQIEYKSLYLEFLPSQQESIREIFKEKKVEFIKDIGGEVFFARIS